MTVNVAEIEAINQALDYLIRSNYQNTSVTVYTDSVTARSVFRPFKSPHQIAKRIYAPYALRGRELKKQFQQFTAEWIPREQNQEVDGYLRELTLAQAWYER